MNICYHSAFNIELGLLAWLHPFDGTKFRKVAERIEPLEGLNFVVPEQPISQQAIDGFVDPLVRRFLRHKEHILRALEVPALPLLTQSVLDKRILVPMRWGVAGIQRIVPLQSVNRFCGHRLSNQ